MRLLRLAMVPALVVKLGDYYNLGREEEAILWPPPLGE